MRLPGPSWNDCGGPPLHPLRWGPVGVTNRKVSRKLSLVVWGGAARAGLGADRGPTRKCASPRGVCGGVPAHGPARLPEAWAGLDPAASRQRAAAFAWPELGGLSRCEGGHLRAVLPRTRPARSTPGAGKALQAWGGGAQRAHGEGSGPGKSDRIQNTAGDFVSPFSAFCREGDTGLAVLACSLAMADQGLQSELVAGHLRPCMVSEWAWRQAARQAGG